ncbi:MAG: Fe-S cluster assembly protein SufD, partial [Pseudomonadota bacterium]
MALPEIKQSVTEARLAELTLPQCGVWASEARKSALARVQQMGLPGRRDEYWKYTDPTRLTAPVATPAALFDPQESPVFGEVDRLKVVFVDGAFDPDASDELAMEHVEIDRLAEAGESDIHWAKDVYGVLEARGQDPVERPL